MSDIVGLALVVVVAAAAAAVWSLVYESRVRRRETALQAMLATFAPALRFARDDPRRILSWHALAAAARRLFPEAFDALDRALDDRFPFSDGQLQAAHARWTADWLAWERSHDLDYKLKASAIEDELERQGQLGTSLGKARLEAVEREQLERYQTRYEEYVTVAKALAALRPDAIDGAGGGRVPG